MHSSLDLLPSAPNLMFPAAALVQALLTMMVMSSGDGTDVSDRRTLAFKCSEFREEDESKVKYYTVIL